MSPQISGVPERELNFCVNKHNMCRAAIDKKRKLGANALKRVAAGAHLPTPWLFEPAKRPDDRADY